MSMKPSHTKEAALDAERLRSLLVYSTETGVFTWRERPRSMFSCEREANRWNRRYAGTAAGTDDGRGYVKVRICGLFYRAHRLAWLYVTGNWPVEQVDHIDGNRANNAIANLREVSAALNAQNLHHAPSSNLSTGVLGVQKHVDGFFVAKLCIDGRQRHLGCFPDAASAHQAYLAAKRIHHEGNTL